MNDRLREAAQALLDAINACRAASEGAMSEKGAAQAFEEGYAPLDVALVAMTEAEEAVASALAEYDSVALQGAPSTEPSLREGQGFRLAALLHDLGIDCSARGVICITSPDGHRNAAARLMANGVLLAPVAQDSPDPLREALAKVEALHHGALTEYGAGYRIGVKAAAGVLRAAIEGVSRDH